MIHFQNIMASLEVIMEYFYRIDLPKMAYHLLL